MFILAQTTTTVHQWAVHPTFWPTRADFVMWCQNMDPVTGAVLIMGGLVFLFSGFKSHRLLIGLTGAVVGAYVGAGISLKYSLPLMAGIPTGALILGVVSFYMTAWAAGGLGAICGALLGASIWSMCNLDPRFAWSGALTGAVALGLLCFIIFRMSVIVFTSMQGSAMFLLGTLGLAYHYAFIRPAIDHALGSGPFVLPAVILGLMMTGVVYQYMKGPGGGGGKKSGGSAKPAESKPEKKEKSKD